MSPPFAPPAAHRTLIMSSRSASSRRSSTSARAPRYAGIGAPVQRPKSSSGPGQLGLNTTECRIGGSHGHRRLQRSAKGIPGRTESRATWQGPQGSRLGEDRPGTDRVMDAHDGVPVDLNAGGLPTQRRCQPHQGGSALRIHSLHLLTGIVQGLLPGLPRPLPDGPEPAHLGHELPLLVIQQILGPGGRFDPVTQPQPPAPTRRYPQPHLLPSDSGRPTASPRAW